MPGYGPYNEEELNLQYSLRNVRPTYETTMIPQWQRQSAEYRQRAGGRYDIAYGDGERDLADFFPARSPQRGIDCLHPRRLLATRRQVHLQLRRRALHQGGVRGPGDQLHAVSESEGWRYPSPMSKGIDVGMGSPDGLRGEPGQVLFDGPLGGRPSHGVDDGYRLAGLRRPLSQGHDQGGGADLRALRLRTHSTHVRESRGRGPTRGSVSISKAQKKRAP